MFRDSLGNRYDRVPSGRKPTGGAKATRNKESKRASWRKRSGHLDKYALYRARVGKPRGPGRPGNKRGQNA